MKPLSFLLLFSVLAIILFAFGALINAEDIPNAEYAIMAFVLKIRSIETHDFKRIFTLYFIFFFSKMLTLSLFIILSSSTNLTLIKGLLFLGISIFSGLLMARVTMTGAAKKIA
ncbi:MAG: hypothetical protein IPI60_17865 [Saprospiraceae bacterium]|nr:hypothetical protein [Saprospiraceae bacterium]